MRGLAPRTIEAYWLQSNSRSCRRSELAIISSYDVLKILNVKYSTFLAFVVICSTSKAKAPHCLMDCCCFVNGVLIGYIIITCLLYTSFKLKSQQNIITRMYQDFAKKGNLTGGHKPYICHFFVHLRDIEETWVRRSTPPLESTHNEDITSYCGKLRQSTSLFL